MKRTHRLIIHICILIGIMSLTSCKFASSLSPYVYGDSEKYQILSDMIEIENTNIKTIKIDWIKGEVNLQKGESLKISENSSKEIKEEYLLRYFIEDEVLRIRFAGSGTNTNQAPTKTLNLIIPSNASLDLVDICLISSSVKIDGINAHEVDVDSVSGTASINQGIINELNIDTVSGSVNINSIINDELDIDTVSGNIELAFDQIPSKTSISSVSGSTTLKVQENASIKCTFSSVSGVFSSELAFTKKGSTYICNEGNNIVDIESTSGDLSIKLK